MGDAGAQSHRARKTRVLLSVSTVTEQKGAQSHRARKTRELLSVSTVTEQKGAQSHRAHKTRGRKTGGTEARKHAKPSSAPLVARKKRSRRPAVQKMLHAASCRSGRLW